MKNMQLKQHFLVKLWLVNVKMQNKEIIKIQVLILKKLWVICPPTRNNISTPEAVGITECSSFSFSNELPLSETDESEWYCISSSVVLDKFSLS